MHDIVFGVVEISGGQVQDKTRVYFRGIFMMHSVKSIPNSILNDFIE